VRVARGLEHLKANIVHGRMRPIDNQLGRAVEATTSANIQWIRLIICIWISRVLSLSVLVASHHMIDWCMYLGLWKCMQLYDKPFSTLAYAFCLLYVLCVGFSLFAVITNLLMWADARTPRGQQSNGGFTA